jgi:16S rRNA (cytosine967-C5)-methyltransferase
MYDIDPREKLLASVFLCTQGDDELLSFFKPEWSDKLSMDLEEKIKFLQQGGYRVSVDEIFPLTEHLSPSLSDRNKFILSHFHQPSLFLRIRPGKHELVNKVLTDHKIEFTVNGDVVEMPNGADVTSLLQADKEIVVQDLSSQRTSEMMTRALQYAGHEASIWDCCAASGGKSILMYDIDPTIDITVSDIRPAILDNLQQRFRNAGIRQYRAFETDMTKPMRRGKLYDIIIADIPCSGSGTWGRTPADMSSINLERLEKFCFLQRTILTNLLSSIKPGGQLIYLTCSVYRDENEDQVQFVLQNSFLKLEEMQLIEGFENAADTLFTARFTLPA